MRWLLYWTAQTIPPYSAVLYSTILGRRPFGCCGSVGGVLRLPSECFGSFACFQEDSFTVLYSTVQVPSMRFGMVP